MTSNQILSSIRTNAAANPLAKAIISGSDSINYQTLELRSNQLARVLQLRGVGPGSLTGIVLERSPQFIITALAIWKAGSAYVPVDPTYPAERIASMLADSAAPVIVATETTRSAVPGFADRMLLLDQHATEIEAQPDTPVLAEVDPDNLAYVIYTSGSTGKPNGVEVTHANLACLCDWHIHEFGVTSKDRATFAASPGFDAAVWEIWPYLAPGATLYVADEITRRSPELLRDWLVANRITITFVPTPLAEAMLTLDWPANTDLRTLLIGADTLHRFAPAGLPFTLVNNYGPTECTVVSTSGRVPVAGTGAAGRPSIGRPLPHAEIRILDTHRKAVPAGLEGEIYIGGSAVARGYRNRPELTASRFISGFFKTGDSGRLLPNGEIEFLGRKDEQVKIRGYRIELGEITAALNNHPRVRASAVVVASHAAEARLVAYLVPRGQHVDISPSEFREFLQPQLPEYMIPATYVVLDELPMTPHGKVDRLRLPEPSAENMLRAPACEGGSDIEKQVAEVLAGLLQTSAVGVDDNFFMLGGHSLLGTQLIVRLREMFGVDLSLLTLFDNPTARSLSAEIEHLLEEQLDGMSDAELNQLAGRVSA